MSKITSFDQAKRLQALGISIVSDCGYVGYTKSGELDSRRKFKEDRDYQPIPSWIRVFTVSEALDWVREEKEIACGVYPMHHGYLPNKNPDIHYGFNFYFLEDEKVKMTYSDRYKSHLLAESALLDAVLDYLEKK